MCKGDTAAEFEQDLRHLSLPSLPVSDATGKVPPVPLPRRKPSTAQNQECANSLQSCVSSRTTHGTSINPDMGSGMKARSCEDISYVCTSADPCMHENNNIQIKELVSSVTDGSCKLVADVPALTDGTVQHFISNFVLPCKPPRCKRLLKKELQENTDSLDACQISNTAAISVPKVKSKSVSDSEVSSVQLRKSQFPQPKPRTSLLIKSTDKTDEKLSHDELAVEVDAKTVMDCTCPYAESGTDTPKITPTHTASGRTEEEMNEKDGQPLDCNKLHDHADVNISSVESEQNKLEVQNKASAVKLNSKGLVPSRAAPPRPLTKPKIVRIPPGSVEVMKPSVYGDGSKNTVVLDNDSVPESFHSSSVSLSKRCFEQHNKTTLSDSVLTRSPESNDFSVSYPSSSGSEPTSVVSSSSTPTVLSSVAQVELENRNLSSVNKGRKVKGPVPAVRKSKKPQPSCTRNSEISSSFDLCVFQSDEKNVRCRVAATRRLSEGTVRDKDSSNLHLMDSDAAGHSSLEPCDSEDVPLGFAGDHQTAEDVTRNSSSPRESCSCLTESGSTSSDCPLSPNSCEIFVAETPPITPAVFRFDVNDEEARAVC